MKKEAKPLLHDPDASGLPKVYVGEPQYPERTAAEWAKIIIPRILLPIILLGDLFKLILKALFGSFVGRLVLPAQNGPDDKAPFYEIDSESVERVEVITHDGATLDTVQISPEGKEENTAEDLYVIKLPGNGALMEHIITPNGNYLSYNLWQTEADDSNAHIVCFNLRNVGNSKAPDGGYVKSKRELITDGIAQVQRLLDKGVPSENITLHGHSLGGGIASYVAAHFHSIGKPIYIYNSNSYSNLTRVAVSFVRRAGAFIGMHQFTGYTESPFFKFMSYLVWPIIKFGVAGTGWEINAADKFKTIPEKYREYCVARSPKLRVENYADELNGTLKVRGVAYNDNGHVKTVVDDQTISHYGSMHLALKSRRQEIKSQEDSPQKEARLALMKARKMMNTNHNQIYFETKSRPFHASEDTHQISGYHHFRGFLRATHTDHKISHQHVEITSGEEAYVRLHHQAYPTVS